LVRAIAKSLDIPIIAVSGAEFVEKYVGVGAARIRKLFNKARNNTNCIIFIDEIDAIGIQRDFETNSERATTLNQLLIEMDGFDNESNIIVFAATNMIKTLDPALLRSGRFDKKIYFDLPNIDERKLMFELYLDDIKLENIDFDSLSERSAGLSGADINTISNQAKINAINRNSDYISDIDLQNALDEIMIGREKRERMLSLDERERVAYHEAGHAIIGFLLDIPSPIKVSIIPRGELALGFSQTKPELKLLKTQDEIISRIAVLLGGRCAEQIIYKEVSTGASDDIEKISILSNYYHTKWGMSEKFGAFNPHYSGMYENKKVSKYCQILINDIEIIVLSMLNKNLKILKKLAKKLLKKETITYKKIKKIIGSCKENSEKVEIN
jgi:cell division protease FtsH